MAHAQNPNVREATAHASDDATSGKVHRVEARRATANPLRDAMHRFDPPRTRRQRIERLQRLADVLDRAITLPGTKVQVGLDGIVGLIPVVGDTIMTAVGAYILKEARALGVRKRVLAKMAGNLGVDWLVGLVPLVGDVLDIGFKAHVRNVNLILREYEMGRLGDADEVIGG